MTARASSSNFERSCNYLFQSWWSCQYRRLRCSADLAARGAAPFVLMKFNQWRQRLNFTVPSCTVAPRIRVAGGSRDPCFVLDQTRGVVEFHFPLIKPKRKSGRKNARSRSARLLWERFATARFFISFFFFFWRPSRKLVVANAKS